MEHLTSRPDDAETAARAMALAVDFRLAVDVGAHRGSWTALLAARFAGVHAFEPAPWLCDRLARRFAGDPRIILHRVALLDTDGSGELAYPEGAEGKGRAGFVKPVPSGQTGDVLIASLDGFGLIGCGLIKIDVEGGELAVLRGAAVTIAHSRPVLVVECKPRNAARYGWTRDDLDRQLRGHGYGLAFEAFPNLVYSA